MSAPKHLWSGDWEADSEAAARERARRRELPRVSQQADRRPPAPLPRPERSPLPERRPAPAPRTSPPAAPPPRPAPPRATPPPDRSPAPRRERPRIRGSTALLVAAVVLILAGAAYGLAQAGGSGHTAAGSAARNTPWLGVNMEAIPVNRVMIAAVTPNSPADRAGLGPGDVIIAIDSKPVSAAR